IHSSQKFEPPARSPINLLGTFVQESCSWTIEIMIPCASRDFLLYNYLMAMQIKIWGARGSLPSPHTPDAMRARTREVLSRFADSAHGKRGDVEGFLKNLPAHAYGGFGGNTPCIEVSTGSSQIIIDGGSGIRPLGYHLMAGPCGKGQGEVHLFF